MDSELGDAQGWTGVDRVQNFSWWLNAVLVGTTAVAAGNALAISLGVTSSQPVLALVQHLWTNVWQVYVSAVDDSPIVTKVMASHDFSSLGKVVIANIQVC